MIEIATQYWLTFLFGGVAYLIRRYFKIFDAKIDRFIAEQQATKAGIQVILRDRIRQLHHFLTEKGFATVEEKDNIFQMYEQYHNLGANGVIDGLIDEICNLPVRERGR